MNYTVQSSDGQFLIAKLPYSSDGWTIELDIDIPKQYANNISLEVNSSIKQGELQLQGNVDIMPMDARKTMEKTWILQEGWKTWNGSNIECIKKGGHLLSIHSAQENDRIFKFTNGYKGWIGASTEIDGKSWKWSDESDFNFTNWVNGKPSTTRGCGYMHDSNKV